MNTARRTSSIIKYCFRLFGADIVRYKPQTERYVFSTKNGKFRDFSEAQVRIFRNVEPYTMLSPEWIRACSDATAYIAQHNVEGEVVECGTWKGGSSMAVALSLLAHNERERNFYIFDTFAGMSEPTEADITHAGVSAKSIMEQEQHRSEIPDTSRFCFSPIDETQRNLLGTGYPEERIHLIKGRTEETIQKNAPPRIALLLLDTSWYQSTKHQLIHLFPRLVENGILIMSSYGHWQGTRRAVDEYISENNLSIFLHRIDYSCRLIQKTKE